MATPDAYRRHFDFWKTHNFHGKKTHGKDNIIFFEGTLARAVNSGDPAKYVYGRCAHRLTRHIASRRIILLKPQKKKKLEERALAALDLREGKRERGGQHL